MHLLAAKPGGFTDDEGIIDLAQTPADMVILSAADGMLAALADAIESTEQDFPTIRLANWMQLLKPAAFDLYQQKVLDHAKLVVVSLLGGKSYWQYGFEQLVEWQEAGDDRHLMILPGDDTPDPELFEASSSPAEHTLKVWQYLRQAGQNNIKQCLYFLATHYLNKAYAWQEPQPIPGCMLYIPKAQRISGHTLTDIEQWWAAEKLDKPSPVCALLFYRSHLCHNNMFMFDQLIERFMIQGLKPLPIAVRSLKDEEALSFINEHLECVNASLIINTTGFASNVVASEATSQRPQLFDSPFSRNIPVLQLVLSSSTEEDWQDYSQGLRSRDIAMQVVLPEMDGRIMTRAVSFKTQAYYHERCEIDVIRYQLHQERADFVVQLAKRYCMLRQKPTAEKRVALILANYPTKDGRIGNGVGLDTPASVVNLLQKMQDAGFPVEDIPDDGTALIHALLEAVTNNPNTVHFLPCWQSIDMATYREYFRQLPDSCQQAVIDQWGVPENDPKCRQNRIMLAGIRLGETFIGIQPARGFDRDLTANYHDPDLIPPHSYLAFYFWLRHCYQVDAIVHVGKHGNLEWLPGKGTALSSICWPDIILGPMPHFYPFIVNDPGEGAQAKRRSQAVIIDHLMPPMARAQTYGELAELEALVDEYYQAMDMDARREKWLRERILEQVKTTHVLDELGLQKSDEADIVLEQLDTYLCDIKESQIRYGLHVLGALPDREKLSETLVALLRLASRARANKPGYFA